MITFKSRFAAVTIFCIAIFASCNSNKNEESKSTAMLDSISLSSKNFALAYQDGEKIVATSIDTMKQISFGGAMDPAISPDGNKLAYTVNNTTGNRTIWVADLENKSQLQLHVNSSNYYQAMWSPNGNAIAFNIFNSKNLWKVGVIKADNTGYLILDSASAINVYSPTWKNEKELVAHDLKNLYTFNVDGKLVESRVIADLIGKDFMIASSNHFFYSEDGTKLIFNAGNSDAPDGLTGPSEAAYILNIASKKIERLSPKGVNVPYIFVTADDRIFYSGSEKPYTQSKIYVSDLKGNIKTIVDKGSNPTGALK